MRREPQLDRLRRLLSLRPGGVTSLEAARLSPPIMRLSERIRELEGKGVEIERQIERGPAGARYTRYRLASSGRRGIGRF